MIYAIICFNIDGRLRFTRRYDYIDVEQIIKCYTGKYIFIKYLNEYNLVYHRFGNFIFCMCVDKKENLLNIGSLINRIMSTFDLLFINLCELNFVYCIDLVYKVLDKFILDGKMLEIEPMKVVKELGK